MAYKTTYPFTGEVLQQYDNATDKDLEQALTIGHKLYKTWRDEPVSDRAKQLQQIANLMKERKDDLAKAMTYDMGKLLTEAQGEVDLCVSIVEYYAKNGEKFMESVPVESPAGRAYYAKQATGVIVAVEPWNFPLYQVVRVFAPNFVVGNPMILKHASICPTSAQMFADLVIDAGGPKGALSNLFISYDLVAKAIHDPRVAGVCLTGSERGGASVAKEAGDALKKSTLELGGNDAFIVLDDADFDEVKKVSPGARLYNAGQVCTSSKRFIVMADKFDEFVDNLKEAFSSAKIGDPMDPETVVAPLSSKSAQEKLQKQVDSAIEGGATLVYGNESIDSKGFFFQPTILTDIDKDNPVYNQEMFGPVAVVYKVNSEQEAIDLANDSSYGLGNTIFSANREHAQQVAEKIETGMSFINSGWASLPELPFGGVKNSGYGRELSELGLDAFVNQHLVFEPAN
ncbi:NAD-dependent succinate-semialdehyde dehydrogenase [Ligilactobacillus pobuzihii]|uniref:Aldehyde dehydrogenase n=1 Tax=Ligilactobacillus pobuzihii TaxID=449659 RepID=A0A0R2L2B2_9LACO|nr:NAD-dependent succinate-semialdehyde dehydrogenase [Ligilactobacillus pobuzihii]KRK11203.1 aldehyde dehydrogenase [Ligilactobacillus pobuzihii E100301 = KCTC 13174]KRN95851.1 aldehyde dehydrogenase [Ligilactobacillus pobuzihii]GEN47778.1 aldehyde dehydrogenase [Ligilactobacillus pobuzihii]